MFGIYFGKYLLEKSIITDTQYDELIEKTKNSKVQMGLLAVEMGLMTEEETKEVNRLQQQFDRRFGDIAVEKGYLTEMDVSDILDRQGDAYLLFIQALLEAEIMNMDEIRTELTAYRRDRGLSAMDLEAVKSGDIDRIAPIFIKRAELPEYVKEYFLLTARSIVRFIDRFFNMGAVAKIEEHESPMSSIRNIVGGENFRTALCGERDAIVQVADGFCMNSFGCTAEAAGIDALDAANEFMNWNNGLFASFLSEKDITVVDESPIMKQGPTKISAKNQMYKMPLFVKNKPIDLIVVYDDDTFEVTDI
ncbi:MAG: hypothetical protein II699_00685 [Lachnospiraceae bacterium]|jgi:hypothetical protein|nr:hypothetical protein [Lachnospiraceae bacterium]